MEVEEDVSLTSCYCQLTAEARDISKKGEKPHVHCPCHKCSGRATWRMTAWRHLQSEWLVYQLSIFIGLSVIKLISQ